MVLTVRYNVVLFGSSKVGKKSFIRSAEQMFHKEAQLQSTSYIGNSLLYYKEPMFDPQTNTMIISTRSSLSLCDAEDDNSNNNNNTIHSHSVSFNSSINNNNKRMSISDAFQNAGKRLSLSISGLFGANNNNNSANNRSSILSNNSSTGSQRSSVNSNRGSFDESQQQYMENMIVEDLRQQITAYDELSKNPSMVASAAASTSSTLAATTSATAAAANAPPPNTIIVMKDLVRYEIHVTSFYDTGFTEEEQQAIVKADGYFIMIDLTNRFSVVRAKIYHKKLSMMLDAHYNLGSNHNSGSSSNPNSPTQNGGQTGTTVTAASSSTTTADSSMTDVPTAAATSPPLKVPFILIGSKSDETQKRRVETLDGIRMGDMWSCPFMECSSVQAHNKGIDSAIREIINMIELKKKRASLALNIGTSPRSKKWRKSFGGTGGFFGGTPPSHSSFDITDVSLDTVGPRTSDPSSPMTDAAGPRRRPKNQDHSSKRHSIAFGKLPSFKGIKSKLGLKKHRNSPSIDTSRAEDE